MIIKKCKKAKKFVIVATQMMLSMTENPIPKELLDNNSIPKLAREVASVFKNELYRSGQRR